MSLKRRTIKTPKKRGATPIAEIKKAVRKVMMNKGAQKWRPHDWDNPHPEHEEKWDGRDEYWYASPEHEAYEAGADAMLEALRREGFGGKLIVEIAEAHAGEGVRETTIYLDTIQEMMKRYSKEQVLNGKWVFISDDTP